MTKETKSDHTRKLMNSPPGTPECHAAAIMKKLTEYPVGRSRTKKMTTIYSDITVRVGKRDIYHFECEIRYNRAMILRMLEYDVHIALEYQTHEPGARRSGNRPVLELLVPYSAVLYLQDNRNIPETLSCKIRSSDGSVFLYKVPAIRVQSYTLEEIQRKHLSILIPFLPLRFRKSLPPNKKKPQIEKGELTSFYQKIILILEKEAADGYLSEGDCKAILSFLEKAMVRVFYKYNTLLEEVIQVTEPILELEYEKIERLERQYKESAALAAQKERELSQKDEALSQKDEEIAELKKMLWILQNPREEES